MEELLWVLLELIGGIFSALLDRNGDCKTGYQVSQREMTGQQKPVVGPGASDPMLAGMGIRYGDNYAGHRS